MGMAGFTNGELAVIALSAHGLNYHEIAKQLGTSYSVVSVFISRVYRKTGLPLNESQQADFWKQWGEILNHGPRLDKVEDKIDKTETRIDDLSQWVSAMKGAWAVTVFLLGVLVTIAAKWGSGIWGMILRHIHKNAPVTPP